MSRWALLPVRNAKCGSASSVRPAHTTQTPALRTVPRASLALRATLAQGPGALAPSAVCQAGHYCTLGCNTTMPVGSDFATELCGVCPAGHYCLNSTALPEKCPLGTYSAQTGRVDKSECLECPRGSFCATEALTEPTGLCPPGILCEPGSSASHFYAKNATCANTAPKAKLCSAGRFCVEGSTTENTCPAGTFSSSLGLQNSTQCSPCDAGKYCPTLGQSSSNDALACAAGHFCTHGASVSSPNSESVVSSNGICPAGTYCPLGSTRPLACPNGHFAESPGAAECDDCPAGKTCTDGPWVTPQRCPTGLYCPNATGYNFGFCLPGTISNAIDQTTLDKLRTMPRRQVLLETWQFATRRDLCRGLRLPKRCADCAPFYR